MAITTWRAVFLMTVVLLYGVFPLEARAAEPVGRVLSVFGTTMVVRAVAETSEALEEGSAIYLGDRLETRDGSRLHVRFIDGTDIALAREGSLTVDEYIFDPARPEEGRARFGILRAAFSYVSGQLSKIENPHVLVDLDFGSIGIRGTRILRAMRDSQCWIYLEDGLVDVSNAGGSVFLMPGQMTRMSAKDLAPRPPVPWAEEDVAWARDAVGQ